MIRSRLIEQVGKRPPFHSAPPEPWSVLPATVGAVHWQRSRWFLYPFQERQGRFAAHSLATVLLIFPALL